MSSAQELEHRVDALGRSSQRAALISVMGLLLVLTAIGFAMVQLNRMQREVENLGTQRDQLADTLRYMDARVDQSRSLLQAINPLLERYGVLETITAENLNSLLVQQSFAANEQIQNILAGELEGRRVPVWYYAKDTTVDTIRVQEFLNQIGFLVTSREAFRPDLPSNVVAYGARVRVNDAKLVAYTLIRAGIQLKAICRSPSAARASVIQVLGDERAVQASPLSVEEIRPQSGFFDCPADPGAPYPGSSQAGLP